ncbi:MAG: hypothetical protein ACLQBL_36090, partial [Polyangiaceae bacterium]
MTRAEPPARQVATQGSFADISPPPGEGLRDENREAIDGVRQAIGQAPADAYGLRMRSAVTGACDAAEAVRAVLWRLADDFTSQCRAVNEIITDAKAAAAKAVPTNSGDMSGHQGYVQKVQAAEASAEKTITNSVLRRVADVSAPSTQSAGGNFVAAMTKLSDEIDSAYADATSPTGLREGSDSSLERIMRLSSIERAYRAKERPALEVWKTFEGLITRGEDEKVLDLIEAVGPLMAEIRNATSKAGTGPRYSGGLAYDAGSERDVAFRFGRAASEWARTQVPESIKIANTCFQDLTVIFRLLCGADVRLMTSAQFAQRHLGEGGSGADAARPFQLEEDWTMRAIPGGRVALSGWSPKRFDANG